jgi:hypothetical protein
VAVVLWDICGPGLYIESPDGDNNFFSQAKMALNILRSRDIGKKLLLAICGACETSGHEVVIEKAAAATAIPTTDVSDAFRTQIKQPGMGEMMKPAFKLCVRGKAGCCGIARWNPSNRLQTGPNTFIERPSYIPLAHELIHCLHFITADCARVPEGFMTENADSGLAEEEARTVGLGPYDWPDLSEAYCENAFRAAFGLAKRTEYNSGNDLSAARRTI